MIIHKEMASGRWFRFTLLEQLANVGADIDRAIRWKNRGELEQSQKALDRAIELFDLTIADPKNRKRLKEILRAREVVLDYFMGDNQYNSTEEGLSKYFLEFNYAAAVQKGR